MRRIILVFLIILIGLAVFFFKASAPLLIDLEEVHLSKPGKLKNAQRGDTLSVMTYNLGYLSGMINNSPSQRKEENFDQNELRFSQLIKQWNPDILGLQEVDIDADRSFNKDQSAGLMEDLEYRQRYFSVNWNKRYVPFPYWPFSAHFGKIISGQAIISKFNLSNTEAVTLVMPENKSFLYKAFYLERLIQSSDAIIGEDTIRILNVHLEAFEKETRLEHARVVRQMFEAISEQMPVLLIGDFNSQPDYVAIDDAMQIIMGSKHIKSAISKQQYHMNPEKYFTFNSRDPYQMIDYILFNENFIQSISSSVVSEASETSDHLPVFMEFVLKHQNDLN